MFVALVSSSKALTEGEGKNKICCVDYCLDKDSRVLFGGEKTRLEVQRVLEGVGIGLKEV